MCIRVAAVAGEVVYEVVVEPQEPPEQAQQEERRENPAVRPRAAGLLIGIECSRVRDSSWMYLTCLVKLPE